MTLSNDVTSWRNVMTWRYDVMSSQKYMNDNILEIIGQLNYGNIKIIIVLARSQDEIDIAVSVIQASLPDVWHIK